MVQRKSFDLYLALTTRMLSGARRVATLLAVMLLTMTAQTAWAQGLPLPDPDDDGNVTLEGGEYIVDGNVDISGEIIAMGLVNLTISDDAILGVMGGIRNGEINIDVQGGTITCPISSSISANTFNMNGGSAEVGQLSFNSGNIQNATITADINMNEASISGSTINSNSIQASKATFIGSVVTINYLYLSGAVVFDASSPAVSINVNEYNNAFGGTLTISNGSLKDGNANIYTGTIADPTVLDGKTLTYYNASSAIIVSLNKQYGSGGTDMVTPTAGDAMPSITPPTRKGYTFGGYYTETNGNGTPYYNAEGSSAHVCDLTGTVTLYAKWTANTYTVNFNRQGGSGGSLKVTATYGNEMPAITLPTKTGYTFDGYFYEPDGNGKKYYNANGTSALIWNFDEDVVLFAKWTAMQYTVTLDQQGGEDGTESVEATYDSAMPEITLPTKTGYTFGGYFTEPNGNGTKYYNADGSSAHVYDLTGTVTLYAKWTARQYTVTLNQQNGEGGTTSVNATYASDMPEITLPTKTGYDFGGYYTETNGNGTKYYNDDGSSAHVYDLTGTVTLYAKWTATQYTVTLDQQGGEGGTTSVDATYDSAMPDITVPTKTGYDFGGYFTEQNGGGTQYYNASGTSTHTWDIDAGTTLYAKWTARQYTVTLDQQGGEDGTESVEATYDSAMPEITLPTKTGYDFGGYYTETNGNGTKYYNADGSSAHEWDMESDATLYAKWTAKQSTVRLEKEGGENGSNEVTATYGAPMPQATMPTREGYEFDGYFTEPHGNGTKYYNADGTSACIWNITDNHLTLFANWKEYLQNDDITIDIPTQTYNGSQLTPVVTVKANGIEVSDAHYNIILPEGRTNAGDYTIQIVAKEGSTAYAGSKTETFTISKAPLTVTAKDHSIFYGNAVANNGVEYDGFVNGEGENVLEGELTYSYTNDNGDFREDNNAPGEYDIIPSGLTSANYAITFVPGTLTVKPVIVKFIVDIANGEPLAGIHVIVRRKTDNNIIHEWNSTTENHEINVLKAGGEYSIVGSENNDYTSSADYTLTIDENGNVSYSGTITEGGVLLIENAKKVKVSVVDIADGEEIEGAHVQVIDSEGKVVKEWTSDTESLVHVITGLNTGEVYTLRETIAPEGYTIPNDFTFTIGTNGVITTTGTKTEDGVLLVENSKTKVKISVVDIANGEELEGATVQVLDKDGNVVDEWVSTTEPHVIEGLKTGVEYTLHETVAPEGYTVATDITFTIDETGGITFSGIKTTDGVLLIQNSKTHVEVCVVDSADGAKIAGAHVQVIDSEGNVVKEWDSTTEPHEIEGLATGEEYTLKETVAPEGYALSTESTFTIGTNGTITFSGIKTTDGVLLIENNKTKVPYIDADGNPADCTDYTEIDGSETSFGPGWYVVNGNISFDHPVVFTGDVNLILTDGKTMTVTSSDIFGIDASEATFTIYGQGGQTEGVLNASSNNTGILLGDNGVTINGGTIRANGTISGAGISQYSSDGKLTINGGHVTATGDGEYSGAIGVNSLTINGGTVSATSDTKDGIISSNVTINGGIVTITGNYNGLFNNTGSVAINGGQVTVTGSTNGIYAGGGITLGSTDADDFIMASSYYGTVTIADGKAYTDGTNNYFGTLTNEEKAAIANVPLHPVTGVTLTKDVSGEITASLDPSSEEEVSIPVAVEVDHVEVDRTYVSGKASTVYLPFSIPVTNVSGGKFHTFTDVDEKKDPWEVIYTEVTSGDIAANTPYIFLPDGTNEGKIVVNNGTDKVSVSTANPKTTTQGLWEFIGTYERIKWTHDTTDPEYTAAREAEIGSVYGFAANDSGTDHVGDFVKVGNNVWINPMRAYLKRSTSPGARTMTSDGQAQQLPDKMKVVIISASGEPTEIGTLDTRTGEISLDEWYSLDGHKLNGKPTKKGVYIKNGNKVVIKN